MATSSSAKKRIRQNERRKDRNKIRRSRIRTFLNKVNQAIEAKDKDASLVAFKQVMPELHRGVSKGLFHKKTVARKLSRLNAAIVKLG